MKLYIGLAGPLVLYLYSPLVLIGLFKLFSKVKSWKTRAWAAPLYLAIAYAIPLGDVTWHSWNMNKACEKAGLHVYRTVVVDGFIGEFAGKDTLERYPYRFVEDKTLTGKGAVYFERSGDQVINRKIPAPTAEWEIARDPFDYTDKSMGVTVNRDVVRSRKTNEVIAEYFVFGAWRGWIDARIASVIDNSAGVCYKHPRLSEEFQKILIPSGAAK